jgi:hypothetical protein
MTRRSKRELERAVDDLAPSPQESATLPEIHDYFDHVAEDPESAPLPREWFAEEIVDGWPEITLPFDEEDLPPALDAEAFTPLERFGLAFLDEDVTRGVFQMRLARGGA